MNKGIDILKHKWIEGNVIYDDDTDRYTRYLKYDDKLIDDAIKYLEELQKENIRLKKQLSKDHHIECSCSFCKPMACSYVDNNFAFTSCNDCKNKIDGTYQEVCSNCKRFYGCYFEAKEKLC